MPHLLIIEDDPHIADVVEFLMEEQGHRVDRATDGRLGWALYQKGAYALVILDLGLPGMSGWEIFERIRGLQPEQPLIMLTAQGEEPERVKGLTLGADDYITKPFSNPELVARVRNLLRRVKPLPEILVHGQIKLMPERGEVVIAGMNVVLPAHEFRLLQGLMSQPGRVYNRDQLMVLMYGDTCEVNDRAVDQSVKRLRKKICGCQPDFKGIETVYGLGYRLRETDS
ncbi:response regulator transcription factor [Kiritimatiellota bacterium B12222]|nr:response regulator transcription factor [Kiritimatiellota bacterium B12222]